MIKNSTIGICNRTGEKDAITKQWIEGKPIWVKDIDVDMQPYSRDQLKKDYGFDIECTNRIFSDIDDNFKVNAVIMCGTLIFKVQKIINWDSWQEVVVLQIE